MSGAIPRHRVVDVNLDDGERLHITPLSDLHLESSACEVDALRRLLEQRATLPHHYVVLIGDVLDLLATGDPRYRRGAARNLGERDDWVNEALDRALEVLRVGGLEYALVSPGNHEDEFVRRHGLDITSILARELGAARGGYSGVLDFRLTRNGRRARFRTVYHHGAWGGRYAKGYLGARHFFSTFDGWNLALYGHCHAGRVDKEVRQRARKGSIESYPCYLVNTMSWTDGYQSDARHTHYIERRGYVRQPTDAPLVWVSLGRSDAGYRSKTTLDYRVET